MIFSVIIIIACIIPAVMLEQAIYKVIGCLLNKKKEVSEKKGDVIIFRRFS